MLEDSRLRGDVHVPKICRQEWKDVAETLDEHLRFHDWKMVDEDPYYDWKLVRKVTYRVYSNKDNHTGRHL